MTKLYSWDSTLNYFQTYKKNIIEDDIIPDENILELKRYIDSYCKANYTGYKSSGNSGYRVNTVDGNGVSECNGCDVQVNCYPASAGEDTCTGVFGNAQSACAGEQGSLANGHWAP